MNQINESFLQFVWKTQAINQTQLFTSTGDKISIFKPGIFNTDAGPDFYQAHIKIGEIDWFGSVEIHVNSSDWHLHNHQKDHAYEPVILHVVWENNKSIQRKDGTEIDVLELKNVLLPTILNNYDQLLNSIQSIPCENQFGLVPNLYKIQMKDAALTQRQISKSQRISNFYEKTNHDLEETAYRLLARNFGFRLNADAFERLATILPYKIIQKHLDQKIQVEALLFGMAGMLEHTDNESYTEILKREFNFLSYKFGISDLKMSMAEWKFLRTRPANFPTLRISQFADFLTKVKSIHSFLNQDSKSQLLNLEISASNYWKEHYTFGKQTVKTLENLGKSSKENILINSVVPLLFFYSTILGDDSLKEKAMEILEFLPAENNAITRTWESLGERPISAFDSQSLIEQFQGFCSNKKCLDCPVGTYLIRKP